MFRSDWRPARTAVRAPLIVSAVLSTVVLALGLSSCTFPGSGGSDSGANAATSTLPAAASPPAGVTDPATEPALAKYYQQHVAWTGCGDHFKCTKVMVPLDWAKPAGATIELAVNKLPAGGDKLGSMLVNPGGPGASGLDYAKVATQAFGSALLSHYDIVGFDPRGIGQSDPVSCLPNSQLDAYVSEDATPDNQAELNFSVSEAKRFAAACQAHTGALLDHVDTLSTVRDLDVIRAAVGDDVLNFHGASYGTYIGAWYAQTFPWRIGRMVLDGAIDPSLTSKQYVAGQAKGFSRALEAYVQDCQSHSGCPLTGSLRQGLDQIGTLVSQADSTPLHTKDPNRPLTQSLMVTGIADALYAKQLWPNLTNGLTNAKSGDGDGLLQLADAYLERDSKGNYGQTLAANPAIFCLDVPETRTPEQIGQDAAQLQQEFPPLGGTIGWGALSCAEWPLKAVMPREKLAAKGAAPILVLGTVDDPATPYEWAQALAAQLSSGRLLTWEGTVHTAYHQGSSCIDHKVEAYMLTGALPPVGTRCT